MDAWQESACVFNRGAADSAHALQSVVCDPFRELVWVGDTGGTVTSYYGPLLRKYSSFVVDGAVLDIQVSEKWIYTLTKDKIFLHKRTGQVKGVSPHAQGRLMLLFESDVLVASTRRIYRYNMDTMQETGTFLIETPEQSTQILFLKKCAPYGVVVGLSNGTAQVVDPHTFDILFTIRCHSGPLTDLDCRKSVIMSCGLSSRRYGLVSDQIVYVWDVRTRKPLPPLNLANGATFVRIHPRSPTNCMVISQNDQLHFMDIKNPGNIIIRQLIVQSKIVGMDVGPQGDSLVVIEDTGLIHHWSRSPPIPADFNMLPKNLELPTSMNQGLPVIHADTPLSVVGMPYYNQELLSSWSDEMIFNVGMPPPKDFNSIGSNVARKYEPLGGKARRSSVSMPKFLSERDRLGIVDDEDNLFENDDSLAHGKIPRVYRNLEIHFSKFGVQDFDFKFYNKTAYSGLENQVAGSSIINTLVQLLRWCPPIHNKALDLMARFNHEPMPVLGELAVLFDMLHKGDGRQCRAQNFQSYLSTRPEVLSMGLLELSTPVGQQVGALFHYIVSEICKEESEVCNDSDSLKEMVDVAITCRMYGSCGFRADTVQHQIAIDAASCDHKGLSAALSRTTESWVWCDRCQKKHSMAVVRQVTLAPPVLFVNMLPGPRAGAPAKKLSLIPRADKRSFKVVDSEEPDYTLAGYVCQIDQGNDGHAVSVICISGQWYLFNDFLITPISEDDAYNFSYCWKEPLLLMYLRKDASSLAFDYESWKSKLDTRLLHEPGIVSGNLNAKSNVKMLEPGENVKGKLVALDAEFVLLGQEIAEIHSNGTKVLLKPKTLSLARVSVVRGSPPLELCPFIDDFVETTHPVVNYLTLYSGIEPGDLDPDKSPYGLVTLRTSTRRLWVLLNLGVIFVGHALVNDFRTINLQVPCDQVLDTAELFYDKGLNGPRRLSLKFLVWALLGEEIQTGNHDSVEDAQSAMRLYYRYRELQEKGELDSALRTIYTKGQRSGFKVPMTQ